MTARWPVTWSVFWPGLAAATSSGVWWSPGTFVDMSRERSSESTAEVSPCDRVVALARHPSFSSVVAERVVRQLHWADLVEVWNATGTLMMGQGPPRHHLNYVRLRAAVLDELERRNPRRFDRWYIRRWSSH